GVAGLAVAVALGFAVSAATLGLATHLALRPGRGSPASSHPVRSRSMQVTERTSVTRHLEIEALQEILRWPDARPEAAAILAGQLLAARRDREGFEYFRERAAARPDEPVFTSAEGLFQARLATAYAALGRQAEAADAPRRSGHRSLDAGEPAVVTDAWMTARDGFRFTPPRLVEVAPGVHVAQGYDFADFAFIVTGAGVVAIDAGSAPAHV